MTPEQIKNSIDQSVTNKTGQAKSITPNILGGVLKSIIDFSTSFFTPKSEKSQPNGLATLDENGKVPSSQLPGNTGGGPGTVSGVKRFPKDESLTEAHIGLLAMRQVTVLNDPPSGIEDFETKVVLSNTTPEVPGVKPVYELEIANIVFPQPVTQVIRITFAENPNDGAFVAFGTNNGYGNMYFKNSVVNPNDIEIGSTLSDTIANFIAFINSGYNPDITVHSTDNSTYIDFEIYQNESNNSIKYNNPCDVYYSYFTTQPTTSIIRSLIDSNILNMLNSISNNGNSSLVRFGYQNGNTEIIVVRNLFHSNLQPYGTAGAFGLQYFADETEAIDALNWAISQGQFSNDFTMTVPLYYDSNSNSFKMQFTTIEVPGYWWSISVNNQFNSIQVNSSTITEFARVVLEQVKSNVLGTIVGIEDNEVLIDTGAVQTLKMASADDGATGVVPVPIMEEEFGYQLLLPWRNGRVIDVNSLMQNSNTNFHNEDLSLLLNNQKFRPLTLAGAGEDVLAKML